MANVAKVADAGVQTSAIAAAASVLRIPRMVQSLAAMSRRRERCAKMRHIAMARLMHENPQAAPGWRGVALSIALAGIASILLRQDSNWDLQNYHYYNAWAFVHRRFG